jgi:hypothetical protein
MKQIAIEPYAKQFGEETLRTGPTACTDTCEVWVYVSYYLQVYSSALKEEAE